MLDNKYKIRLTQKLRKYRQKNNALFAYIKILTFFLRDIINHNLTKLLTTFNPKRNTRLKKILFLEPRTQGYGDLLFQTSIFEALSKKGYEVSIVIQKKHLPIVLNNPYIIHVYYWNDLCNLILLPLEKYASIVFLSKNTLIETLFGLFFMKTNRTILDQNLHLWHKVFSHNHTLAWQILLDSYFGEDMRYEEPHLYIHNKTEITNTLTNKIAIVAGVDKKEKRYYEIVHLLNHLNNLENTSIYLVGICDKKYENTFNYFKNKPFYYYINKLSYGETINLLSNMNLVVGTEGSLTQVSTTLHIPTIIIETGKSFWRYSNLGKTHNIKLFSKRITADHIFQEIVAFQINLHQ